MGQKHGHFDPHLEATKYWGPSMNTFLSIQMMNDYGRRALDLGCGSFRNSKFLSNCGFIVDAIDKDPRVKNYTDFFDNRVKYLGQKNRKIFTLKIADYIKCNIGEEKYDIVVAENSLSFNDKDAVETMINKIYVSLKKGGYFAGNLYGLQDFRSSEGKKMSFYTKSEVESLLYKFKVKELADREGDSEENGVKFHWHAFEFIVQK